jgi:hypothetical protein
VTAPLKPFGSRSFSCVPMEGDRVVRLVYLDEAGLSNPSQEPFLVVAGIVVNADKQLNAIENYLENLMHRHIPPEHHEGFVFSAKHIFNGNKTVFDRNKMPLSKRLEIVRDLAAIPKKFNLQFSIGFLERSRLLESLPRELSGADKTVASHALAFMTCAMSVEQWMRRYAPNEVCMLVAENNDQARKFITDSQRYHQDKKIVSNLSELERRFFPLRKIKEDPLFQPKRQNHPLVIADFVAYVWKKALMKDSRYDWLMRELVKSVISFEDDDALIQRAKVG